MQKQKEIDHDIVIGMFENLKGRIHLAKESGDGIFFSEGKKVPPGSKNINQSISKPKKSKSHLTVVK